MAAFCNLVVIIEKADQSKTHRHCEAGPDKRAGKVHPQQHGNGESGQDHQSAHGRRADLRLMALRAIGADGLALALPHTQHVDEARADHQADDQCRQHRRTCPEGLVTDEVQQPFKFKQFGEEIEHGCALRPLLSAFSGGEMLYHAG